MGRGGFSTVYKGYQQRFDRWVAVKVMDVERLDEATQRRFERECAIMGRLSGHPHVVTIYDSGTLADGRPYLLTEFCDRGSLAQLLSRSGPLPAGEAVEIGVKLATALQAAHDIGIVHRDIKPGNVLLRPTGEPALADFGLSFRDGQDASRGLEAFSLPYAAPEALTDGHYTAAGDVYALGSTLFALVTGSPPFPQQAGEAPMPYIRRVLRSPPPVQRDDIPLGLQLLLLDMLAKRPADRPGIAVVLGRLRKLPASGLTAAHPSQATTARIQPHPADDAASGAGAGVAKASWQLAPASGAVTEGRDNDLGAATLPSGDRQPSPRLPAAGRGGSPPGRLRRNLLRLAGAAGAAMVGVAMAMALLNTLSDGQRSPPAREPGAAPQAGPQAGSAPEDPQQAVPDGYRSVDGPNGLVVAIPDGWDVKQGLVPSDRQADDPSDADRFVRFGGYRSEAREGPLLAVVRDLETAVAGSAADYTRLRLEPVAYGSEGEAIDWEFRFTRDGRARHAYGRYWRVADVRYVVYVSGPEDQWESMRPVFEIMTATANPR